MMLSFFLNSAGISFKDKETTLWVSVSLHHKHTHIFLFLVNFQLKTPHLRSLLIYHVWQQVILFPLLCFYRTVLTACMNGNKEFLNGNDFLLSFCVIPTSKAPCNSLMPRARDAQGFFFPFLNAIYLPCCSCMFNLSPYLQDNAPISIL